MDRRTLTKLLGTAATLATVHATLASQRPAHAAQAQAQPATPPPARHVAMLVFPGMTILDLIGAQQFFAVAPGVTTHLVWKEQTPIVSDTGVPIVPTATFADVPDALEVLFAPGGFEGSAATLRDPEVLAFLADRGERARYVTSVCTGALILGAAGLLDGYQATTHWAYHDLLPLVGAAPVQGRVVEDGNRITGGGVTSGIDFGLTLLARLVSEEYAQGWQLGTEYDPQPPFDAGTPQTASPFIKAEVLKVLGPRVALVREALVGTPGYTGE